MNFNHSCLDEIALEGLDGITLPTLWLRLENRRPKFSLKLDDAAKNFLWDNALVVNKELEFYSLPEPRPPVILYDRFSNCEPETGVPIERDSYPEEPYPVAIIGEIGSSIMGSCSTYGTRECVTAHIRPTNGPPMSLGQLQERWNDQQFVIVASQRQREETIFLESDPFPNLTPKMFCMLERVGRSRYLGETTNGTWNLLKDFNESSKTSFYIRKSLLKKGLINVQMSNMRLINGQNTAGKLLHLARFYVEVKPFYVSLLENITTRLAAKPNQTEVLKVIRSEMGVKDNTFKKLCNYGNGYIMAEYISQPKHKPESPGTEETEEHDSKHKEARCKPVRYVKLLREYSYSKQMAEEEAQETEDDEDDPTTDSGSMFASLCIEVPILGQVFAYVLSKKEVGISQMEVCSEFGITKLDARLLCRNFERMSLVKKFMHDIGKQREQRYVANCYLEESDLHVQLEKEKKRILKHHQDRLDEDASMLQAEDAEEGTSTIPKPVDKIKTEKGDRSLTESFLEDIDSTTYQNQTKKAAHVTYRMLRRANMVIEAVKQARLIDNIFLLQKKIIETESAEGFKFRLDKKSLVRLIQKLHNDGQIKSIKTMVNVDGVEKPLHFLCEPSMTSDDPLVQSSIESNRNKMLALCREAMIKTHDDSQQLQVAVDPAKPNHALLKSNCKQKELEYDNEAGKRYGYQPRMKRLQTVHEFLWYLVYGYDHSTESFFTEAAESDCVKLDDKDGENSKVYRNEYTWRRYLPPPPQHRGYPEGWCLIGDILLLLPLSIFVTVIRTNFKIPELEVLLADPVKRFTLVCQLPSKLRQQLFCERKYIFSFFGSLTYMVTLGQASFGKREFKEKQQVFLYLHKVCGIVDTSLADIVPQDRPLKRFTLNTYKDVRDYWFTLQWVCLNTPLDVIQVTDSEKILSHVPNRFEEAVRGKIPEEICDTGHIPGDGLGAGGTDSSFYVHLKRNWTYSGEYDPKTEAMITDGTEIVNKRCKSQSKKKSTKILAARKKTLSETSVTDSTTSPNKELLPSAKMPTKTLLYNVKPLSQKRLLDDHDSLKPPKKKMKKSLFQHKIHPVELTHGEIRKEMVAGPRPKKGGKGLVRSHTGKEQIASGKLPRPFKAKIRKKKEKEEKGYDEIDQLALKKMTKERVEWSSKEDSLLLLCQVTQEFLCDDRRDFIVNYGVIRDILSSVCPESEDKTSKACGRRIKYMMKQQQTITNIRMFVGEAMQDKELYSMFKTKKYVKTNCEENRDVFSNCLFKLREKFKRTMEHELPELPDTLEEIHKRYNIHQGFEKHGTQHEDPESERDIQFSVLHNLIHCATLLNDKTGRAHELYQLFSQYPEDLLFSVFNSMKEDHMLTKIKKMEARQVHKDKLSYLPSVSMGTYHLAQRYSYNWLSRYPRTTFENAYKVMSELEKAPVGGEHPRSLCLDHSSGSSALVSALMLSRAVYFETVLPEQVIVVSKKKSSKKVKKQTTLTESDAEEDEIINQAEQQQQQPPEPLFERGETATRAKVLRHLNLEPSDNLMVRAATVSIRLKPNHYWENPPALVNKYLFQSHEEITEYNKVNLWLHQRTAHTILRGIRFTQPATVLSESILQEARGALGYDSTDMAVLTQIINDVKQGGYMGKTFNEIRTKYCGHNKLKEYLLLLTERRLVGLSTFYTRGQIFVISGG